ncbi:hypothetical protein KCU92_g8583, partial [Aureobasidium melanogenum]
MPATNLQDEAVKSSHRTFIHTLFDSVLQIPIRNITTLPRCNNNFVHLVNFSTPNPAAMFNHAAKIENTVAMMQLTRQALSAFDIVSKVYAWSSVGEPSGTGWILEQYMSGIEIESKFHTELTRENQHYILSQMAAILKAIQDFELPPKASGFGGLAFDDGGEVVSRSYVVEPYNGLYSDMISIYKGMLQAQLAEADRSPVVKGYRDSGHRDRLNAFAERAIEDILTRVLPQIVRPNLILGDIAVGDFVWALHPGGRAIIDGVQKAMSLTEEQLRVTREIYRHRGNSSSPTVLAVLDMLRSRLTEKNFVVAAAFGPGISVEMNCLRMFSAQGVDRSSI